MPNLNFHGANAAAYRSRHGEILLAGPAGTGKSYVLLAKCLTLLDAYPGCRGLFCRGTRASLTQSGLVTLEKLLGPRHPVLTRRPVTRRVRQSYEFPNGSELVVAGLDDPGKTLSAEYDFCFVAGTEVSSPTRIERGFDRPYSGRLVTITTDGGNKLTGTPNHPILTPQGWVGLGRLRQGDYVFSRRRGEPLAAGTDPDVAHEPTPIAEVVRSLSQAGGGRGTTERVETVPMHFHGDGAHGYVDVVTPFGLLKGGDSAGGNQPVVERDGRRAEFDDPLLVGGRPLEQLLLRVGAFDPSLTHAEPPHPLSVGFRLPPRLREALGVLADLLPPDGVRQQFLLPAGEGFSRGLPLDASGLHLTLEPRHADPDGSGNVHQPPLAGEVALDRVVDVAFADTGRGRHVYNLQTAESWYFANNIIAHNCYIQEATEEGVTLDAYETLLRSLRNGKTPWTQMMSDCNPTRPTHFLYKRQQGGGPLKMFTSRHEDNPAFWDRRTKGWTDAGRAYLATLDRMTGPRLNRFRKGLWVAAEGLVYDGYDPAKNVHPPGWEAPKEWRRVWGVDWGYVQPLVVQVWAVDGDNRMHLCREIYKTKTRVEVVAKECAKLVEDGAEPVPSAILADHDPENIATFRQYGRGEVEGKPFSLPIREANKRDRDKGIQLVQGLFDVQADGKPRIFFHPNARRHRADQSLETEGKPTSTLDELVGYIWEASKPDKAKDEPIAYNDHGMDCMRYVAVHVQNPRPLFGTPVEV